MASNIDLTKPLKKRKGLEVPAVPVATATKSTSAVDLNYWVDSSVLVRCESEPSIYKPGKIVSHPAVGCLHVLLDQTLEPTRYCNVLQTTDILSNHPPIPVLITEGLTVCVKAQSEENRFILAKIKRVESGTPIRCLVETSSPGSPFWVPRANIRLLQPPWQDELHIAHKSLVSRPKRQKNLS